ncbi:MAG: prolipoprotein diacylglyceryl transferase, partial [Clostridia bacterium]|nr:prolipoprotein diacylglyceryl transferase [Clostridia bacterium]
ARLYYVLFSGVSSWTFLEIINIRSGGLAIYGGIIGGVIGIALFSIVKKFNIIKLLDVAAVCVIIAQSMGRWGNFFNQEAYGSTVTNPDLQFFPIAIQILADGNAWHYATFFYESLWCLIGFILLISLYKRKVPLGVPTCVYLIFYGIGRALIEGLRTDSLYIGAMRVSQLLSIILVLIGIIGLIVILNKNKRGKINGQKINFKTV